MLPPFCCRRPCRQRSLCLSLSGFSGFQPPGGAVKHVSYKKRPLIAHRLSSVTHQRSPSPHSRLSRSGCFVGPGWRNNYFGVPPNVEVIRGICEVLPQVPEDTIVLGAGGDGVASGRKEGGFCRCFCCAECLPDAGVQLPSFLSPLRPFVYVACGARAVIIIKKVIRQFLVPT